MAAQVALRRRQCIEERLKIKNKLSNNNNTNINTTNNSNNNGDAKNFEAKNFEAKNFELKTFEMNFQAKNETKTDGLNSEDSNEIDPNETDYNCDLHNSFNQLIDQLEHSIDKKFDQQIGSAAAFALLKKERGNLNQTVESIIKGKKLKR